MMNFKCKIIIFSLVLSCSKFKSINHMNNSDQKPIINFNKNQKSSNDNFNQNNEISFSDLKNKDETLNQNLLNPFFGQIISKILSKSSYDKYKNLNIQKRNFSNYISKLICDAIISNEIKDYENLEIDLQDTQDSDIYSNIRDSDELKNEFKNIKDINELLEKLINELGNRFNNINNEQKSNDIQNLNEEEKEEKSNFNDSHLEKDEDDLFDFIKNLESRNKFFTKVISDLIFKTIYKNSRNLNIDYLCKNILELINEVIDKSEYEEFNDIIEDLSDYDGSNIIEYIKSKINYQSNNISENLLDIFLENLSSLLKKPFLAFFQKHNNNKEIQVFFNISQLLNFIKYYLDNVNQKDFDAFRNRFIELRRFFKTNAYSMPANLNYSKNKNQDNTHSILFRSYYLLDNCFFKNGINIFDLMEKLYYELKIEYINALDINDIPKNLIEIKRNILRNLVGNDMKLRNIFEQYVLKRHSLKYPEINPNPIIGDTIFDDFNIFWMLNLKFYEQVKNLKTKFLISINVIPKLVKTEIYHDHQIPSDFNDIKFDFLSDNDETEDISDVLVVGKEQYFIHNNEIKYIETHLKDYNRKYDDYPELKYIINKISFNEIESYFTEQKNKGLIKKFFYSCHIDRRQNLSIKNKLPQNYLDHKVYIIKIPTDIFKKIKNPELVRAAALELVKRIIIPTKLNDSMEYENHIKALNSGNGYNNPVIYTSTGKDESSISKICFWSGGAAEMELEVMIQSTKRFFNKINNRFQSPDEEIMSLAKKLSENEIYYNFKNLFPHLNK
ncbi:MAG: hypothetical protein GY830_00485 [Bacteroidetes bacterium]|nr:hypothetical protein [Bacteroidota bacterium]